MATATVIQNNTKKYAKVLRPCENRISEVVDNKKLLSEVIYKIPFRIKITNITIPGYSPTNIPPIGIAIIGVNNYIL